MFGLLNGDQPGGVGIDTFRSGSDPGATCWPLTPMFCRYCDRGTGFSVGVVEKTLDPDAFVRELLSVVAQPANAPADRLYLPNNLTSPREARMFVRRTLSRWDIPHLVNDALLLTSELVANAVLHAESELEVRMAIRGDFLRIEVIDSHPGGLVRRNARLDATSGRGLAMVNSLAVLWGSDPVVDSAGEGAGKSVWFELPVKTEAARD